MSIEARTFWLVWCPEGGSPTVRHYSPAGAREEAQRLARTNPGRQFYVCRAMCAYEKRDVDCIDLMEDMPF